MHTIRTLLAAALLLLAARPADAQRYDHERPLEERFQLRDGQTLFIDADLGAIEVRGVSGGEAVVRVLKGANDVSEREAEELFDRYDVAFQETSRGLEVRGTYDKPHRWGRNPLAVRYEVSLPRGVHVDLRTAGGSIAVEDVDGEARLRTSGGSLALRDVGGAVNATTSGGSIQAEGLGAQAVLHTSGGSISVEDARGNVEANTSGGSIRVRGVRGDVEAHTSGGAISLLDVDGIVDAHTSGGSIEAELNAQPERPVSLETSGGSVTIHLPAGTRADLDARASGGRVRFDVPVTVQGEVKRDRLVGTLNGGGPRVTLRSSGGSVYIRER